MEYVLTYFDTVSVQDYIFSSNKLKHIIGASALVHQAANDWVFGVLQSLGKTNVNPDGIIEEETHIDQPDVSSELIYAGGGNAVILFKPGFHTKFARLLSLKILREAPGLDFVICHDLIKWDPPADELRAKLNTLIWKASIKKQNRPNSALLLGLGVTILCPFTGKPAAGRNSDNLRVSSEILAKEKAVPYANQRLAKEFDDPDNPSHKRDYLFDLNEIEGEQKGSYMAVVHCDGTDVGKRIKTFSEKPENADNREFITQIRAFSDSIKRASKSALKATIEHLEKLTETNPPVVNLVKDTKLPFRPVVFGGDDITFVCDGMIALPLAAYHLEQLYLPQNNLTDKHPIFARSGVAVVKSHFPFSQAYSIAEDLNKNARHYAKEYAKEIDDAAPPAALDWYFTSSGPVLDLARIREEKYTIDDDHKLMMRPLVVGDKALDPFRSWASFLSTISALRDKLSQTQRKYLLENLVQGPHKFREVVEAKNLSLPKIPGHSLVEKDGWIAEISAYHDPLEAIDFLNWKICEATWQITPFES